MGKWSVTTLSKVATIVGGSTPKTSVDEYWNGEYNWVTPAELNATTFVINETERKITEKAIKDTSLKLLPIGTILLSSRAPIGKVAIAGVEMYCNQGFKNFICSNKIYNKYLFWFLKGKTEFLNSLGRGATFKEISKTIVEKIQIPLPPLKTQKQIAKTLDTTAELLTMRKQQLSELNNLIKSNFYYMFGNPVTNEKEWEIISLGGLLEDIKYGTSTPPVFSDIGYSFIRATNIKLGRIIDSGMKYISENEAAKINKCKLQGGELIIVRSGVNTGDTCVIAERYVGQYAGYDLIIKPNQKLLNSIYLNELINTNYMVDVVKPLTRRAAQPHLNAEQTKNLPIILPPFSLQTQFASIVTKIEEQKALVKKAIDETQVLFDSLMSEYFK